ncbi:Phosphoglucosamine mutase [subsurface metagenome]
MLPEYPTVREKVACSNEKKADVTKKFKTHAKREFLGVKRILTIDGVRLEFESGWVLVRPSGTEPYIRVTVEGKTPTRAKEIARKAVKILRSAMQG